MSPNIIDHIDYLTQALDQAKNIINTLEEENSKLKEEIKTLSSIEEYEYSYE